MLEEESTRVVLRDLTVRLGEPTLEYVIAEEGNTSAKFDYGRLMLIKASGTSFLDPKFVVVDTLQATRLINGKYTTKEAADKMKKIIIKSDSPGLRPSREVVFHSVLKDYKWIAHAHPREVEGFVCSIAASKPHKRMGYLEKLEKLTGKRAAWVHYAGIGIPLAKAVKRVYSKHKHDNSRPPDVILLQNHGIIVGGAEPIMVEETMREYTSALAKMRMEIEQGLRPSLLNFGGYKNIDYSSTKDARKSAVFEGLEKLGYSSFAFSDSKNILRLVSSKKGESYATRGNIAPEQVLYLGLRPLWVSYNGDPKEELNVLERGIKLYITRFGSEPRTIYFEGLGVVAVGRSEAEGTLIIRVAEKLADVLGRTLAFDGPRYLTKKQEEAILAT